MNAIRSDALAVFAAVMAAFALFQSLDAFIDFCEWFQPMVYYWRYFIYLAFDTLLFWLPFALPSSLKDALASAILVGTVIIRSATISSLHSTADKDEGASKRLGVVLRYSRSVFLSCGLVLGFFLFPLFGWAPADSRLSQINDLTDAFPVFFKLLFGIGALSIIILLSDDLQGKVRKGIVSRQMWRIVIVIVALISVNEIGLRADSIPPVAEIDVLPARVDN